MSVNPYIFLTKTFSKAKIVFELTQFYQAWILCDISIMHLIEYYLPFFVILCLRKLAIQK